MIEAKKPGDHALIVFKAAVSAVPYVGSSIAGLINDYIPSATERAFEEASGYFKARLDQLEERIDPEAVNRDDFSEMFKTCMVTVARTHRSEKLRAASALLSNVLLKDGDAEKLSFTELDHFARCLETLSIGALRVLGEAIAIVGRTKRDPIRSQIAALQFVQLKTRISDWAPDLVLGLVAELNAAHLLNVNSQQPQVFAPGMGNFRIEVTPLGFDFSFRILNAGEDDLSTTDTNRTPR